MISLIMRQQILRRDNFTCQLCFYGRRDGVKLQVDHKLPVSKGGKDTEENLWTLCLYCNLGKGNRWDDRGTNSRQFRPQYLHKIVDGQIRFQGRLIDFVRPQEPGCAVGVIEWFDWIVGEPNGQTLVPLEEIIAEEPRFQFYQSAAEMRQAWESATKETSC